MDLSKEIYIHYDKVIKTLYINFYSYAIRNERRLELEGLNLKEKGHKLFLEIALQAASLNGYTVYAKIPLLKKILIKKYRKVKKEKKNVGMYLNERLENLCEAFNITTDELDDIYNDYYARKK